MRTLSLAIAVSLVAFATMARAESKKQDPTKMTCAVFASQTPEAQERVTAYLDGVSKQGTKLEDVGEVDVDRELDVMLVACQQEPKLTLWEKFKMHLPGGKKRVKIPMTCEAFLALGSDIQPEVAYFLAGYNRQKNAEVGAAGEVDLERDVAVLVEECKPAPQESLWDRIKKHF